MNLFQLTSLLLVAVVSSFSSNMAQAQPTNAVTEITCELESATDALKDDLKCRMRRVRGYGVMQGYTAQIRSRAKAIDRRICRDPNYRGLDRDVARIATVAGQLSDRLQTILDCPHTLARAEGDITCIINRVQQICSLSRSLEIAARPFCIHVDAAPVIATQVVTEFTPSVPSGRLHAARPGYFDVDRFDSRFDSRRSCPSGDRGWQDRDFDRQQLDSWGRNDVQMIPPRPLPRGYSSDAYANELPYQGAPATQWTAPREPQQTLPRTTPRGFTNPRTSDPFTNLRPELPGQLPSAGPQLHGPQPMSGRSILDRR